MTVCIPLALPVRCTAHWPRSTARAIALAQHTHNLVHQFGPTLEGYSYFLEAPDPNSCLSTNWAQEHSGIRSPSHPAFSEDSMVPPLPTHYSDGRAIVPYLIVTESRTMSAKAGL